MSHDLLLSRFQSVLDRLQSIVWICHFVRRSGSTRSLVSLACNTTSAVRRFPDSKCRWSAPAASPSRRRQHDVEAVFRGEISTDYGGRWHRAMAFRCAHRITSGAPVGPRLAWLIVASFRAFSISSLMAARRSIQFPHRFAFSPTACRWHHGSRAA